MTKIIGGNTDFANPTPLELKQRIAKMMDELKNSKAYVCENPECGGENFLEIIRLRKTSGLVNGTGQDRIYPVPVYACASCGHVNQMFLKGAGIPIDEEPIVEPTTGE